ncbi:MAG: 1-acyl-sn-glycerol-3-phosphate acyltransferase, partial [Clostridiales bacterium]|nr:1-acyl-sn-glycerol-3-phosphate acyltransferase [Clostridiales bacterium]
MKKYYSPIKPYSKIRKPYLFFRLLKVLLKPFLKPRGVTFDEPFPSGQPIVIMANHANAYGPQIMQYALPRPFRTWTNAKMLSVKTAPKDLMKTVFCNAKGIVWVFCRMLSFAMGLVMSSVFRAAGAVPVYRNERIAITYRKTFETLKEGMDVLIFPDSLVRDPDNEFMDVMQKGAFKTFRLCLSENGYAPKV